MTDETGGVDDERAEEDQAGRNRRLRAAVLAVDAADLRAALGVMPQPWVAALAGRARVAWPVLRRSKDPAATLQRLEADRDADVLGQLAGVVSHDCLEAARDALGDSADDPGRDELRATVLALLADFAPAMTATMLACVVHAGAEAAELCDEILRTDHRFAFPDEPVVAAPTAGFSVPAPKVDEEEAARKREARRQRRQAKAASRPAPPPLPPRSKRKAEAKGASASASAAPPAPAAASPDPVELDDSHARTEPAGGSGVSTTRPKLRAPVLTNRQQRDFDPADPWVGGLVWADIEFDTPDPDEPGLTEKRRPAVVVAGAPDQLLVRAAYTGGFARRDWRSVDVRNWHAAGLDGPAWIEPDTREVPRARVGDFIGWLSPDDWNRLW